MFSIGELKRKKEFVPLILIDNRNYPHLGEYWSHVSNIWGAVFDIQLILDYLPLEFVVKGFRTEFMFSSFPQISYFIVWSHVTGFPHFALDNLCLTIHQASNCFL
jgi:hypothetical protein